MINYMVDFDNSIKIAYDKFYDNKDVCLIVTADHESGGLKLASTKEELTDELYTTDGHTHDDVRYFIYQKDNSDIYKISDIIDNTNIFLINTKLLNLKYEDKEKTL
jgi:alkaline phosphatase